MDRPEPQVAFLRGINVGGAKKVGMGALKQAFEKMGCSDVRTVLASGNVAFRPKDGQLTAQDIRTVLAKALGFDVRVMVRSQARLQRLLKSAPFKGMRITPKTRLYVSFLAAEPESKPQLSNQAADFPFTILQISDGEVLSMVELSAKGGTLDAMAILEEKFGKDLTTRNWNTLGKLCAT